MTAKAVTDELLITLGRVSRKVRAIERKMEAGALPKDMVLGALQAIHDGRFAEDPTSALVLPQRPPLIHGLFAPPEEQIANVVKWNAKRRWGFTAGDLKKIPSPPAWPSDRLVAVVLVPYLDDHQGIGGIQRTFDEVWDVGSRRQKHCDRWSEVRSDPQHLTLLPGITHTPGLRWEVIDLGANWDTTNGIAPKDVRSPATSPHAGILAAVAHHRRWVRSMNGTTVPFVWLPGYMLAVPGGDPHVPLVRWIRGERLVRLGALWDVRRDSRCSVPAFRLPAPRESGR